MSNAKPFFKIEPSAILSLLQLGGQVNESEYINILSSIMELNKDEIISFLDVQRAVENTQNKERASAISAKEAKSIIKDHLAEHFYEVEDDRYIFWAADATTGSIKNGEEIVTPKAVIDKFEESLKRFQPNAYAIPKPRKGDWGEDIIHPNVKDELDTSGDRPSLKKKERALNAHLPLSAKAKSKKKWMQNAVNKAETGELRSKYEKRFNVTLDKDQTLSLSKLKQWKKELQAKGKGDKNMSDKDRETLQQIIFAINAKTL